MRSVGVVTGARSDYGIYLPLLRKIDVEPDLQLHLIVTGMHLSPEFGLTESSIKEDGFEIKERVEMLLSSDTPEGIAKSIGIGIIGFAQTYSRFRPDILIVLGDRFEMYAAALAAFPFKIPLAHIHGGEVTRGSIDDGLRHSITKLSHLHFVSTEAYRRRVIQMGEEPWRVIVSGAPSLDNLSSIKLLSIDRLEEKYGLCLRPAPLLVTFHPVTLEYEQGEWQMEQLLFALDNFEIPIVFTMPNADIGGRVIIRMIEEYVSARSSAYMVRNLGTRNYFSLMAAAKAMVGNSSSGVIEAPSFKLPVVNIGSRQDGRVKSVNVVDVGYEQKDIINGLKKALHPEFSQGLSINDNPYGSGNASEKIVEVLKNIKINNTLVIKYFKDIGG